MKIVSVIGAGGLGKTTLAKAVYDLNRSHFACGAFVPVGQTPDPKKVLRDILIDLDKHAYINSSLEKLDERQLLNELRGFLQNKRYFIVIDDLWEPRSWETIKLALVENICGSRIIITTRKLEVAKKADEVYKLEPLSQDNSKKLFYTRLFGCEDKCPTSHHVVELSHMILKKCGGIPLAIITMASFLLGKSKEQWIDVCNSPGFYQDNDDQHMENTMHILSLSYYDLPSHLKTCLLYLSVYPEDTLIYKDSLIWKWIGEGFVEKKPGRGLFEVGEEYYHDLINRSLIAIDSKVFGISYSCRVHDMVRDLIISMSHLENFASIGGTISQSHARRIVYQKGQELDLTGDSSDVNLPQVRSIIGLECNISNWASHPRLKLTRVLALENCRFTGETHIFKKHIVTVLHLRYLGIECADLEVPEEIGRLKFLQILNLKIYGILKLPCSIGSLTQLVHLGAERATVPVGVSIGKLTALEELQIGGHRDSLDFQRQFLKDLGNLSELRVLKLYMLSWNMDDIMQIDLMQSLGNLKKMQYLHVSYNKRVNVNAWDVAVLSRDLRGLILPGVPFPKLPSWISSARLSSLAHLVLKVTDVREQDLKALGRLPELCFLDLFSLRETSFIMETDGCFQKLTSLVLNNSMVQFVASGKKDNNSRVVIMPSLEKLEFFVNVKQLMQSKDVSCGDLGFEYLPSIRKVKVLFYSQDNAYKDEVEKQEAALRQAIEVHPNRPTLRIHYSFEQWMKSYRRSKHDASAAKDN